jgi:hypothetical protein
VVTSSDEDDPNMKPDELTGCYTAEMDPKAGPKVLTPAEAAFQRAAGEDWSWMSEKEQKFALAAMKKLGSSPASAPPRAATRITEPEIQAPAKAAPLEIVKATSVRAKDLPEGFKKAAASPRAPADQPNGTKVPTPTKEQQAPKHPMETRKRAQEGSRAGGF